MTRSNDPADANTIRVDEKIVDKVCAAIKAALDYEEAMRGKRKIGITGEVGEVLVCHEMDLLLVLDNRARGYDAIDANGQRVEIKTRRSESDELPKDFGRVSRFSKHPFDYALLAILDHSYRLREIWRADYDALHPIIAKQKRRNPHIGDFKDVGHKVFDQTK